MKASLLAGAALLAAGIVHAQSPPADEILTGNPASISAQAPLYIARERGPNQRVIVKVVPTTNALGQAVLTTNRAYVELATGMHYLDRGVWKESRAGIEILPDGGAAATQAQHQVYFPADIYEGAIRMKLSEGKTELQFRPLWWTAPILKMPHGFHIQRR